MTRPPQFAKAANPRPAADGNRRFYRLRPRIRAWQVLSSLLVLGQALTERATIGGAGALLRVKAPTPSSAETTGGIIGTPARSAHVSIAALIAAASSTHLHSRVGGRGRVGKHYGSRLT